ncbi:MAG: hypothetical protein WD669_03515 [Pirellulales bacterium]
MKQDDDSIEVHFNERGRHLDLVCGPAAFRRILDFLRTEALLDEIVDLPPESAPNVKWIGITNENYIVEIRQVSRWRNRFALLGCGLVASLMLFVFVMGIPAIAGLVPLQR